MNKIVLILILLGFSRPGMGQVRRLSIGDALPPIDLKGFHSDTSRTLNTFTLTNKVVIFSFWSTNCSSCIAKMPELENLQKQFGDSIAIILVTEQPDQVVHKFWKSNHITKKLTLPTLVGDSILSRYFPHLGVPYEVWIDAEGIVKGLTTAQYVNESNIRAVLARRKVDWPISQLKPQLKDALLFRVMANQDVSGKAIYYSIFSLAIHGLRLNHSFKFTSDTLNRTKHFRGINFSILNFYRFALAKEPIFGITRNRLFLKVADSSRYFYNSKHTYREEWIKENTYCYESTFPIETSEQDFRISMLSELDRAFNLKSSVTEKEVLCWVLKQNGKPHEPGVQKKGTVFKKVDDLLQALNYMLENAPVIDETNMDRNVNIVLTGSTTDFERLNVDLAPHGLEMQKALRKITVLEIVD